MAYQTILPRRLAEQGLTVETIPGWETRGGELFSPGGAVCHWTAGPRNAIGRPCLNVVIHGHGSLPGPLCNVYLDRNGIAVVVAAGRANHAGKGGWKGLAGNSSVFGTEAEAGGPGDWTPAQRISYPKVNAAFATIGGFNADMVCGHNEWAPTRKVDIEDWTMDQMRKDTQYILDGGTTEPIVEEEERMKHLILAKTADSNKVWVGDGLIRRHVATYEELTALQYLISLAGGNPTIKTFKSVDVLGQTVPTGV